MEILNFSNIRLHQLLGKVQIDDIDVEIPSKIGDTALHNAVVTNDVHACQHEVNTANVNAGNLRGDTALHLAVKLRVQSSIRIISILIGAGSNINAQNKWGQTPLHYAVIARAQENVLELVKLPSIDLNAVDVNGFTPLHCCFSFNKEITADYYANRSYDLDMNASFIIMAENLIKAGASVNCQTRFDQSVLHFAATRDDNTPLIKHLISNFPEMNLTPKNIMGENFIHVYCTNEVCEEIVETLAVVAEMRSSSIVKELLSDVDVYGRTPWVYLIDTVNIIGGTVESILNYGVSVNKSDNLGNTALHRIAGVSAACVLTDVIQVFINTGADLNKKNIYGESPAFVLFLDSAFDIFNMHKMDFNSQDRWSRNPLMSMMKHRPIPDLLYRVLLEGKADINRTDAYGSTPLHFAAYHNYEEQVQLLLELGADINAKDSLQDKPIDTVRRHCSYRCHNLLDIASRIENMYPRQRSNDEIILELPKTIKSTNVKSLHEIDMAMGLPEHRIPFWDYLLQTYYDRTPENSSEVDRIGMEVNSLVESLCGAISKYDPIFKMSIFPTGSSAEQTKVGRPDEFDFVLCIDQLNKITKPVMIKECIESGFACLKFTHNPVPAAFQSFCDSEGYFLAFPFLQHFNRYLKRALNESSIWNSGNLYYNYEDKMEVIKGKPVFNFDVYWVGCVYKQLKISIDLVPAVYKRGFWPANINFKQMPLMTEAIQKSGCFLILQSRSNEFNTKKHLFDSNICFTCNNDTDRSLRRMLRVSAAPAEICLMQSLPVVFRRAYALAKILKSKEICPKVELEAIGKWTKLLTHQIKFEEKKPLPAKPSNVIKSYMLKNCIFYTMLEMKNNYGEQDVHPSIITAKVYQYLLHFSDKRFLNPFFLPFSDVFEFEKDTQRSTFDDFVMRLKRELSIKLILGMLKQPFPEECLSSKF
ncbi:serine/threonine-protein phosphatase 6 regulatory ankyrin repeat subunit A [Mytilus galloprovincialis]|uniref:Serine/threonine-protein phosphatase 6 regulatory ankyrin repeat subunit A n=1 Tax=Mytilus galloprovincialis TaxID=29158 RepID=A0A8B6D638_MYTGA|nr:serine/threonine-protein phosphatase 6 regulatory ankyrin repeat subunit A [Mytilus galloprovincialis]